MTRFHGKMKVKAVPQLDIPIQGLVLMHRSDMPFYIAVMA